MIKQYFLNRSMGKTAIFDVFENKQSFGRFFVRFRHERCDILFSGGEKMEKNQKTCHLDAHGRVTLPKPILKQLMWEERDEIDVFIEEQTILLRKHTPNCVFCGKTQNTVQYKGKVFCSNCWGEINSLKILTKRED